ncbi:MAG: hypothetical protein WDO73_36845 [Ignavibacteriota bacterium]
MTESDEPHTGFPEFVHGAARAAKFGGAYAQDDQAGACHGGAHPRAAPRLRGQLDGRHGFDECGRRCLGARGGAHRGQAEFGDVGAGGKIDAEFVLVLGIVIILRDALTHFAGRGADDRVGIES